MVNSVYFASTTLHLYTASVIAAGRSDEDAHLVFIDQPEGKPFPLYDIVSQWQESPFRSVRMFHGRFPGLLNKVRKRRHLFTDLKCELESLRPKHIFVGNDRRIEFQFAMKTAEELGCMPEGHYMDEGIFTYLGRKASSSLSDMLIDNWAKKISYGMWWKNPPTIGGSDWIACVHTAFPQLIHPLLKGKKVVQLDADRFTDQAMLSLSSAIMAAASFDEKSLQSLDMLFTLPHESLFDHDPSYKDLILDVIRQQNQQGKRVAVKYHPRNSGPDILNLKESGVHLLPAQISFEALLPLLPDQCEVWGDLSSTLLIARWLRPAIQVNSVLGKHADYAFIELCRKLDINIVENNV